MLIAYVGLDDNERLKFEAASVEEILEKCEEIVGNDPAQIWLLYYEDQEEIDPWFGDVDKVDIIDSWKEKHPKEYEEKEERKRLERKKRHEEYLANKYVKLEQLDITKMEEVSIPSDFDYDYQGTIYKQYNQGDQVICLWTNSDILEKSEEASILVNFTDVDYKYETESYSIGYGDDPDEEYYIVAYTKPDIKTQIAFVNEESIISKEKFMELCELNEQQLNDLVNKAKEECEIYICEDAARSEMGRIEYERYYYYND